jgi:hypothetical protein
MSFEAKIVADSISKDGVRLITMQLKYPRLIHSEFMTHRVFSRNASSSRAIPVAKMIEQVRTNPAMPVHWGANQPGMQAHAELADPTEAMRQWRLAANQAADRAQMMNDLGLHKQVANRVLEPFQWISVIVTATEWTNFFELRDHEDAQPEIRHLAKLMKTAMDASTPALLVPYEWHLPYVDASTFEEIADFLSGPYGIRDWTNEEGTRLARKVSAARCARVSYLTHDGKAPSIEADLALYERLMGSVPLHASPVEHQARPDAIAYYEDDIGLWFEPELHGNFKGWMQNRKLLEVA